MMFNVNFFRYTDADMLKQNPSIWTLRFVCSHIVLSHIWIVSGWWSVHKHVLFEQSKCVDYISMSYTVTDPILLFLMNIQKKLLKLYLIIHTTSSTFSCFQCIQRCMERLKLVSFTIFGQNLLHLLIFFVSNL